MTTRPQVITNRIRVASATSSSFILSFYSAGCANFDQDSRRCLLRRPLQLHPPHGVAGAHGVAATSCQQEQPSWDLELTVLQCRILLHGIAVSFGVANRRGAASCPANVAFSNPSSSTVVKNSSSRPAIDPKLGGPMLRHSHCDAQSSAPSGRHMHLHSHEQGAREEAWAWSPCTATARAISSLSSTLMVFSQFFLYTALFQPALRYLHVKHIAAVHWWRGISQHVEMFTIYTRMYEHV